MNKSLMKRFPQMLIPRLDRGVKEQGMTEVQNSSLNKQLRKTDHMLKFIHYLNNAGYEAVIPGIEKPPGSFNSLESAFQFGLESERKVTKEIYELVDIAAKEKDYSTYSFLQWFVTEQTEEETLFQTILQKFELLGRDDKLAIYQIDQTLSAIRSQVAGTQTQ